MWIKWVREELTNCVCLDKGRCGAKIIMYNVDLVKEKRHGRGERVEEEAEVNCAIWIW